MVNRPGALLHLLPHDPMKLVPPLLLVENGATSSMFLVSEALKFLMESRLLTLLAFTRATLHFTLPVPPSKMDVGAQQTGVKTSAVLVLPVPASRPAKSAEELLPKALALMTLSPDLPVRLVKVLVIFESHALLEPQNRVTPVLVHPLVKNPVVSVFTAGLAK